MSFVRSNFACILLARCVIKVSNSQASAEEAGLYMGWDKILPISKRCQQPKRKSFIRRRRLPRRHLHRRMFSCHWTFNASFLSQSGRTCRLKGKPKHPLKVRFIVYIFVFPYERDVFHFTLSVLSLRYMQSLVPSTNRSLIDRLSVSLFGHFTWTCSSLYLLVITFEKNNNRRDSINESVLSVCRIWQRWKRVDELRELMVYCQSYRCCVARKSATGLENISFEHCNVNDRTGNRTNSVERKLLYD